MLGTGRARQHGTASRGHATGRVCWAPFHIDRVMWSYIDIWTDEHHRIFKFVHLLS
ncbi:hypothetical protein P4O66_013945, partial [Electrophorus voltai]